MDKFYLGSKSPRRAELLKMIHLPFEKIHLDIDEVIKDKESAQDYSRRITQEKLNAVWEHLIDKNKPLHPLICADTEVVMHEKIYGKPNSYEQAFSMLKSYSGNVHQVVTSVGLRYKNFNQIKTSVTLVYFDSMSDDVIHQYLSLNEYQDKAGGYGIQSYLAQYISKIEGCYYSVMGLPLNALRQLLNALSTGIF